MRGGHAGERTGVYQRTGPRVETDPPVGLAGVRTRRLPAVGTHPDCLAVRVHRETCAAASRATTYTHSHADDAHRMGRRSVQPGRTAPRRMGRDGTGAPRA